jgi:HEAT repeat protein
MYRYHFRNLPPEVLRRRNAAALRAILRDERLPDRAREHAAGALGQIGDGSSIPHLIAALGSRKLRRGAAVALGLLQAKRASKALESVAEREPAARWALAEIRVPLTAAEVLDELEKGHLRQIPRTLGRLPEALRPKVQARVTALFRSAVAGGGPTADDRWLITALQELAPQRSGALVSRALHHANEGQQDLCPSVRHRLLRAISAILPPRALPPLAETVCEGDNPAHVRMALLNIRRIVKARDRRAVTRQVRRMPTRHRRMLKKAIDLDGLPAT